MKRRKQTKGRRGRRNRDHQRRCDLREAERQRLVEEHRRKRQAALNRILPRLRRFCPLSSVGACAPRDGNVDPDRRNFYSVDGRVQGWFPTKDQFVEQFTYNWDSLDVMELERLAKIKRWDPIVPKPAMEILAEAFAGLHEDL